MRRRIKVALGIATIALMIGAMAGFIALSDSDSEQAKLQQERQAQLEEEYSTWVPAIIRQENFTLVKQKNVLDVGEWMISYEFDEYDVNDTVRLFLVEAKGDNATAICYGEVLYWQFVSAAQGEPGTGSASQWEPASAYAYYFLFNSTMTVQLEPCILFPPQSAAPVVWVVE
jgi:hypothetical protein